MERQDVLEMMGKLQLVGMRAAFDEVLATGLKRKHAVQDIIAELLKAEIAEKQARSIKYQLTIARLPLAKEIAEFDFHGTPINESLVRALATGAFLDQQRNLVLVGGTGTGKSHLCVAIARACIRAGRRGSFYNVVDLVNQLEAETRSGRPGRIADQLVARDFVVLDELGYLPFAQSGGQLLGQRQLGDGEPILDRARLLLGDLGLEQLADDPRHRVLALEPIGNHLVEGGPHARELQLVHDRKNLLAFHQMALLRLS